MMSKYGRPFVGKSKKSRATAEELQALFTQHKPTTPFDKPVTMIWFIYPWKKTETKANRQRGMIPHKQTRSGQYGKGSA